MADISELRAALLRRTELEEEVGRMTEQLPRLEREVKELTVKAHNAQVEADALSGTGVKNLLLGLTGKKEAQLACRQSEARAAKAALNTAAFQLETVKSRLEAAKGELAEEPAAEGRYLEALEALASGRTPEALTEAKEALERLDTAEALKAGLEEKRRELKTLLEEMEYVYIYGDLQTDMIGKRYDNKFRTMKMKSYPCQKALLAFLEQMKAYELHYGVDFAEAAPGPWTDNPTYLTDLAFDPRELYGRSDNVYCWLQRQERCMKKIRHQTEEKDRLDRAALRENLFSLHDRLTGAI